MITGAIKNQVDIIWYAFRSGGISNPLDVLERWGYREKAQWTTPRTALSFCVPRDAIVDRQLQP